MVFSIDTIVQSKNKPLHNSVTEDINYDISLFESALSNIIQEQRDFEYNMISLNEGLAGKLIKKQIGKVKSLDIKDILSKIFDWFCNAIQKIQEAFSVAMVSLLNKNVRLTAFKKKLSEFEGEVRYNHKYYDYTNILNDASYANYQSEISKEYDNLINRLQELESSNTPMEIADTLNNIKNDIDYNVDDLNVLRGKILGSNSPISAGEFSDELFKYFRNGRSKPHNPGLGFSQKNLTTTDIQQAYDGFFSNKKQDQVVKRESFKLKSQAMAQKSKIKNIKLKEFLSSNEKLSSDISKQYSAIINIKCRKIKDICDIYILFYAAKLDAIKEYNIKNRDILLAAISEITKQEVNKNDK